MKFLLIHYHTQKLSVKEKKNPNNSPKTQTNTVGAESLHDFYYRLKVMFRFCYNISAALSILQALMPTSLYGITEVSGGSSQTIKSQTRIISRVNRGTTYVLQNKASQRNFQLHFSLFPSFAFLQCRTVFP